MVLRRFLFYLYKEKSPIQFAFAVKTESDFFQFIIYKTKKRITFVIRLSWLLQLDSNQRPCG